MYSTQCWRQAPQGIDLASHLANHSGNSANSIDQAARCNATHPESAGEAVRTDVGATVGFSFSATVKNGEAEPGGRRPIRTCKMESSATLPRIEFSMFQYPLGLELYSGRSHLLILASMSSRVGHSACLSELLRR